MSNYNFNEEDTLKSMLIFIVIIVAVIAFIAIVIIDNIK
jgi:hypothetical protein